MNEEISELQKRINAFKMAKGPKKKISNSIDAFTIATELVTGVIVGLIIGLFFDRIFNSKPLFLIICLLIGIVASFKIIWQTLNRKNNGT
jgi:ATP synthase protein I